MFTVSKLQTSVGDICKECYEPEMVWCGSDGPRHAICANIDPMARAPYAPITLFWQELHPIGYSSLKVNPVFYLIRFFIYDIMFMQKCKDTWNKSTKHVPMVTYINSY